MRGGVLGVWFVLTGVSSLLREVWRSLCRDGAFISLMEAWSMISSLFGWQGVVWGPETEVGLQ